jgi:hypothetical protein
MVNADSSTTEEQVGRLPVRRVSPEAVVPAAEAEEGFIGQPREKGAVTVEETVGHPADICYLLVAVCGSASRMWRA